MFKQDRKIVTIKRKVDTADYNKIKKVCFIKDQKEVE